MEKTQFEKLVVAEKFAEVAAEKAKEVQQQMAEQLKNIL